MIILLILILIIICLIIFLSTKESFIIRFYDYKKLNFEYTKPDIYDQINEKVTKYNENTDTNQEKLEKYSENLKNINRMTKYPVIKRELTYIEFDSILLILKIKYKFTNTHKLNRLENINTNSNYLESYNLVKDWITEQISMLASHEFFKINYINSTGYFYTDDELIYYKANYKEHLEQFIFKMRIYRKNKFNHFIVYFDILFDNYNTKYFINNMFILERELQDKLVFGPFLDNTKLSDKFNNNIKYEDTLEKYIKSKKKKNIYDYDRNYCFYKDAKNKLNCISPNEYDDTVGIYDSPCVYDQDCPFYKKNSNYPNSRGGCKNGYCEMPINIKLIGYKEYLDSVKPFCYNCKKTKCTGLECNMCCEEQFDKKLYPNLDGPDFAFDNDFDERIKHSSYFESKQLSPVSIIV